jgi:hypothetical protein
VGSDDEPFGLMAITGPLAIAAVSVLLLHLLPNHVLTILAAWILGSFPIGVLVGHCALSEA